MDTRKISICSHKGGVGKTALAVNLAANLARMSKSTLLVDLSPQADATCHLGVKNENLSVSVRDVLSDEQANPQDAVVPTHIRNLSLVPADKFAMSGIEIALANLIGREAVLSEKIRLIEDQYDYIIFDCPSGTGLLTINALMAATEWILPVQAHYLSLNGLDQLFMTAVSLEQRLLHKVRLTGIVCTLYDSRTRLSREIEAELRRLFGSLVLDNTILYRTSVGESATFGMSLSEYEPDKEADRNFKALTLEIIRRGKPPETGGVNYVEWDENAGKTLEGHPAERRAIRRVGRQLGTTIQAMMGDSELVAKIPVYGLLSDLVEIEEYRKRKRAALTTDETDELWK